MKTKTLDQRWTASDSVTVKAKLTNLVNSVCATLQLQLSQVIATLFLLRMEYGIFQYKGHEKCLR